MERRSAAGRPLGHLRTLNGSRHPERSIRQMNLSILLLLPMLLSAVPRGGNGTHAMYHAAAKGSGLPEPVFSAALRRALREGPLPGVLAIANMRQSAGEERLYVFDMRRHRLLMRALVAHGQGSGDERCERVSNRIGSRCTCAGLLRVGERIASPRHGDALLLHGLDPGINDRAMEREIIIHGADYVSRDFIRAEGRLGRSWGCPAVGRAEMARLLQLLPPGSLLYIQAP